MSNLFRNMNKGKERMRLSICLFLLLLGLPVRVVAQSGWVRVPLTIEAYINDHKKQRSLLLIRAGLEESNSLLHKVSQATSREYKDINVELDKYSRAFDIIDFVYQTAATGFNVYNTYTDVRDKIEKYRDLLEQFNDKVVKRGKFESADTLLLFVSGRAVMDLAEECENLYHHVAVVAAYGTGGIPCTTANLTLLLENINFSLERIRSIVSSAYYRIQRFIEARTKLWKRELYRSKTKEQMVNEALGRWQESWGGIGY